MALLKFFLRPIPEKKYTAPIAGAVLMLLFSAASVYMTVFFELPLIPVAAALAVLCAVFFRIKLHCLTVRLPLIWHIISLLVFAYMAYGFYSFPMGETAYTLVSAAACGTVCFSLTEIAAAAVMGFLSDGAHPESFAAALGAVFPLLFTVFAYVPSETYFSNSKDLLFVFADFAPYIFIRTAVFTLIAAAAMCTLKAEVFRIVTGVTVGLTLCVYCQYIFMNGSLPSALGEPVDWEKLGAGRAVNTAVWCLLLALPVVYAALTLRSKALGGNAAVRYAHVLAGLFIGGVQVISLVVMIFTSGRSLSAHERYMLDNSEQFVVSDKKNIVTFILDAADRHYFDDMYEKEPERFGFLKDFTYYDNACMMYDATYISIPQMLSGTEELPEYDLGEWLNSSWSSDPCEAFYSRLHEAGYRVNVYGDFAYNCNPFAGKFDNCLYQTEDTIRVNYDNVYKNLNALAAYRYMPMILKESFVSEVEDLDRAIVYENTSIMDNKAYLESLDLKVSDSGSGYFIVEHLLGTHWQAGGTVPERVSDCLDVLKRYTDQLKELGLYDSSTIIVTGDHGEHFGKDSVPIWYIKPAGAHNDEMQVSHAPIHHTDFLATCIAAAGLKKDTDGSLFGRSVFDIGEDEQRERLVFQRFGFDYAGEIEFKRCFGPDHQGAAYGYYFTGTREDLAAREAAGPPDIVLELSEGY